MTRRCEVLLLGHGYTGRLIRAQLIDRGVEVVTADLRSIADERVDARATESVRAALTRHRPRWVVNATSRMIDTAVPTLCAAVAAGCGYLDVSGEPASIAKLYKAFPAAPVPVVAGCGFEFAVGETALEQALRSVSGPARTVTVDYHMRNFWPSNGSALSGLTMADELGRAALLPTAGRYYQDWPGGERVVAARRHPETSVDIRFSIGARGWASYLLGLAAPRDTPLLRSLLTLPGTPSGPPGFVRRRCAYTITALATAPTGSGSAVAEGTDPYGLSARLVADALALPIPPGVHTPVQAIGPHLIEHATDFRITWHRRATTRHDHDDSHPALG
ncbi:hypothetical protein [Nocardia sp. NPDC046763]|uniref:hypothetical protein n=1 Tax=Nocardia sp. NPDC046763 TaxID=3155256 RepID=UPI0033C8E590